MEARDMQDSDQAAVWEKLCSQHLNNITGEFMNVRGPGIASRIKTV